MRKISISLWDHLMIVRERDRKRVQARTCTATIAEKRSSQSTSILCVLELAHAHSRAHTLTRGYEILKNHCVFGTWPTFGVLHVLFLSRRSSPKRRQIEFKTKERARAASPQEYEEHTRAWHAEPSTWNKRANECELAYKVRERARSHINAVWLTVVCPS